MSVQAVRRPKGGYDFSEKTLYRSWVWDRIRTVRLGRAQDISVHDENLPTLPRGVLFMPGSEALEVEAALDHGFILSELYAVDDSPAVAATISRKFPGISVKGTKVEKEADRLSGLGVSLEAVNLDYCCALSPTLLRSVQAIAQSQCTADAHIFVNFLRGREESFLTGLFNNDQGIARTHDALGRARGLWVGEYPATQQDAVRIQAVSRVTGRMWWSARVYLSTNGQTFITLHLSRWRRYSADLEPLAAATAPGAVPVFDRIFGYV